MVRRTEIFHGLMLPLVKSPLRNGLTSLYVMLSNIIHVVGGHVTVHVLVIQYMYMYL